MVIGKYAESNTVTIHILKMSFWKWNPIRLLVLVSLTAVVLLVFEWKIADHLPGFFAPSSVQHLHHDPTFAASEEDCSNLYCLMNQFKSFPEKVSKFRNQSSLDLEFSVSNCSLPRVTIVHIGERGSGTWKDALEYERVFKMNGIESTIHEGAVDYEKEDFRDPGMWFIFGLRKDLQGCL
jgi:hypothetical protein